MKSMKQLFRKIQKDKKNEHTSQSSIGEKNLAVEESTEFGKADSEQSVSLSDHVSLNKIINDDGTVQSDLKSEVTFSCTQRRTGARKSRRALREENRRALAIEMACSTNGSSENGDEVRDSIEGNGPGVFVEIPVPYNAVEQKDTALNHRSRSRSRDCRRSEGRASSKSQDRLTPRPPRSQRLTSRSRSSDVRRKRRGNATSDDEAASKHTDDSNASTDAVPAMGVKNDKAFLCQLQKATKGGNCDNASQKDIRENAVEDSLFHKERTVIDMENPNTDQSSDATKDDHPMGTVTRERRARRSDSRDGRRRARSGSRDKPISVSEIKEKSRSQRSVSRDGKKRSSHRERRPRSTSREVIVPSKQNGSRDRLANSSHHSKASKNLSGSTGRRPLKRTTSLVSTRSNEGIKLLFGGGQGTVRHPSADKTILSSNINEFGKEGLQSEGKSDEGSIVPTNRNDEEKQIQKVSVVFKDECNSIAVQTRDHHANDEYPTQDGQRVAPASILRSLSGEETMQSRSDAGKRGIQFEEGSPDIPVKDKEIEGEVASTMEMRISEEKKNDRLSEREKRNDARKARRDRKTKVAEAAPKTITTESNLEALLGLIGSSADDFKSDNNTNTEGLFDTQPLCSVDFFQSLTTPSDKISEAKSKRNSTERKRGVVRSKSSDDAIDLTGISGDSKERKRGVIRTKSSDDAKDLQCHDLASSKPRKQKRNVTSTRNILPQSEHGTDGRRMHEDAIENASLPPPSLAGERRSKSGKKIEIQSIVERMDEEVQLRHISSAGDPTVNLTQKDAKVNAGPIDAFVLLDQSVPADNISVKSTMTSKTRDSRKIQRRNFVSNDAECDQSLAPPSLAGDTMPSSVGSRKESDLHAPSVSHSEESGDESPLPRISRRMSKKPKSFAVLQRR
jgi:hypothetical protein